MMESNHIKRDNLLSIAFDDGNADDILTHFGINKSSLEETIKNNYKNFIKFKASNQNESIENLMVDILKNKTIEIHEKTLYVFNVENLSSFSLKDKKKIKEINKLYKARFVNGENYFLFGGVQAKLEKNKIKAKIKEYREQMGAIAKNLSDSELIALSIYTDEYFFKISNALLRNNISKVFTLLVENEEYNKDNIDKLNQENNLSECALITLLAISGLKKIAEESIQTMEIHYTFRGESPLPLEVEKKRSNASRTMQAIGENSFFSSNFNRLANNFYNGLAGSCATMVIGIGGCNMSPLSLIKQKDPLRGENECLYGPSWISWQHIATKASIPLITIDATNKDEIMTDPELLTNCPNSLIIIKKSDGNIDIKFTDISKEEIISINESPISSKLAMQIEEKIAEIKKNQIDEQPIEKPVISPENFESIFGEITDFRPTKNFFLAIPANNPNSIFHHSNLIKKPLTTTAVVRKRFKKCKTVKRATTTADVLNNNNVLIKKELTPAQVPPYKLRKSMNIKRSVRFEIPETNNNENNEIKKELIPIPILNIHNSLILDDAGKDKDNILIKRELPASAMPKIQRNQQLNKDLIKDLMLDILEKEEREERGERKKREERKEEPTLILESPKLQKSQRTNVALDIVDKDNENNKNPPARGDKLKFRRTLTIERRNKIT